AAAALERTLPLEVLQEATLTVRPGDVLDSDQFIKAMGRLGYEFQEPVRLPGQYSRRGGILDVYATGRELPVRIELFGDEVESIRQFDPNSQRSVGSVSALYLAPSREVLYPSDVQAFKEMLLDTVEREASFLEEEKGDHLRELVKGDADTIAARQYFDRLD